MRRGFEAVQRQISALGARWGLMGDEAFQEGLRGWWRGSWGSRSRGGAYDGEGLVFGRLDLVEIDVAVRDGLPRKGRHVGGADVCRDFDGDGPAEPYEKRTGEGADRWIMATPYAEEKAKELGKTWGRDIFSRLSGRAPGKRR